MKTDAYEAATAIEVGRAQDALLGEKPRLPPDSVIGDPDVWHSPINAAEYDEPSQGAPRVRC